MNEVVHEPGYVNWQLHFVLASIAQIITLEAVLYMILVTVQAHYKAARVTCRSSKRAPVIIYSCMILLAAVFTFAIVGVLLTDRATWNTSKHFSIVLIAIVAGEPIDPKSRFHQLNALSFEARCIHTRAIKFDVTF